MLRCFIERYHIIIDMYASFAFLSEECKKIPAGKNNSCGYYFIIIHSSDRTTKL